MLNEITNDNAVEEVGSTLAEEIDTSVENATPTVDQKEVKDYLSSSLFEDVKSIKINELDSPAENQTDSEQLSAAYSGTLVDISEHQLVQGRVVGMNDRDVLIDIGFKSEGLIVRSEFNEDSL